MGYFLAIPILALAAILQVGLLPKFFNAISPIDVGFIPIINMPLSIELYHGQLGLVLILVMAWSIHADIEEAIFWAFLGGIFQDVLSPIIPTGASAFAFVLMVFVVKALEHNFYRFSLVLLMLIVPITTVVQHFIVFLVLLVQHYQVAPVELVLSFTLPTIGLNLLACVPLYIVIRLIQKRLPRRQNPWEVAQVTVADS